MAIHDLTVSRGGSMSLWDATNFVLNHTPRWDVAPTRAPLVQPWSYVPPPPRPSTYTPPDPLPARWVPQPRRSWWRRNWVPVLVLIALLVFVAVMMVTSPR
jgi:hypothetical protein